MSFDTELPALYRDLAPKQADGLACVKCGVDYTTSAVPHVPVGYSETRSQVFVCAPRCGPVTYPADAREVAR